MMTDINLSNQIRTILKMCGERQSQIAAGCDIHPSALSRFMSGQRCLSAPAVDRVVAYLDLRLVSRKEWEKRDEAWRAWRSGQLVVKEK